MTNYYASYPISGGGTGIAKYANFAAFPPASSVANGTLALALDTDTLYVSNGTTWEAIASPGDALSIGTFDSGVASANGAHIDSNQLIMQSASATVPGLVNLSTQTLAGVKTFSSAPQLSSLTASLPLQLDASKNIISAAIDLASSEVTGILPPSHGGTGAGSFTAGSIPYSNGTILTQDNANLFWDGTNHRLGLGTTTPNSLLQVAGNVDVANGLKFTAVGGGNTIISNANANSILGITAGTSGSRGNVWFGNSNGTDWQMAIDTVGNVGINTTTPGSRLEIIGNGTTSATSSLNVTNSSSGSLLFVEDDGKVGVGISTPSNRMTIKDAGTGTVEIGQLSDATAYGAIGFTSGLPLATTTYAFAGNSGATIFNAPLGATLDFRINNANKLLIDTSGHVGINVGTPVNALDVRGAVVVGASYAGVSTAPSNGLLVEGNVGIGTSAPASKLEIKGAGTSAATSSLNVTNSSSTSLLFVEDDGKVGINTATPAQPLHVVGNTRIDGTLFFNGSSDYIFRPSAGLLQTAAKFEFGSTVVINRSQFAATNAVIQRVRSTTGQTSNLTDWEDDVGTPLASITASGQIKLTGGTPGSGKVLTSDSVGLATWTTPTTGTVTSVAMTVPTFLSVSGSPITSSGTLAVTLSGTALPILNGGTGQTTANNALNAFLPTQTSNSGKALTTDGSNTAWSSVLTNPMTTAGDIIVGGVAGAPARLAIGASTTVLLGGSTPTYGQVTSSQVNSTVFSTNQASAAPAGATTIGTTDPSVQLLTPSVDFSLKLDNTYVAGRIVTVVNLSTTKIITVIANAGATIRTVYPTTSAQFICTSSSPTIPGSWVCPGRVTSDWIAYTPTTGGIGTPSPIYSDYRRSGSDVEVRALMQAGTVAASVFTFSLPSGLTTSITDALEAGVFNSTYSGGDVRGVNVFIAPANNTQLRLGFQNGANGFTAINGNAVMGNSAIFGLRTFSIPITGWAETTG